MPVILFLLSIGLQLTAAVVALLLIRTTGRKLAWIFLSLAMGLMAWRRIVSFVALLNSGRTMTFEFPEYIALLISFVMLVGVFRIGAYFQSIRIAEEERELVSEKLRASEKKFKDLFASVHDGILVVDVATKKFMFGNKMICKVLGYDEQEIKKLSVPDIHPEKDLPYVLEQLEKQARGEIEIARNIPVKRKDEGVFYADISASPLTLDNKACLIGIFRDITEKKIAEDKLKNKERQLREAQSIAHMGSWEWDLLTNKTEWSEELYNIFGISTKALTGNAYKEFLNCVHPLDRERVARVMDQTIAAKEAFSIEYRIVRPDGIERYIQAEGRLIFDHQGQVVRMHGSSLDITERKQIEEHIKALSLRQEAILAAVPDIIMEVDDQKVYTWANKAGYEFFGEDVIGKEAVLYFEGEQDTYTLVEPLFKGTEDVFYVESWQKRKDGESRLLAWWCRVIKDERGNVKGALSSARDITEYRKLEEQLLHAHKMESIGTLAGGVAHDFNNILQTIIGYGNIALINMKKDDPLRQNIEHILEGADRAAHLTKELLLFSRKQAIDRKPLDLNEIIRKNEKFLRRVLGEDIDINTTLHDKTLPVLGDSYQIEQVLMNIAANTRDAMPNGGNFTVTTEQVTLKADFTSAHGYGKPGPYARITVSDTGSGIDEATQKRIFEPFFTSKEVGKGTGLGLSVVYGIIKQHDGFINVYSEPGKGTTFRIYLPIIASELKEKTIALQEEKPVGGMETVLVAEDDESLRKLSRTVLTQYGYTVIEAVNGEDAVKKFMENKDAIQILLFDLIMPKMSGKEAYDEILKVTPDIKVIFVSGYAPEIVRQKVLMEKNTPILYKPVSPFELLRKIREILDN